MPVHIDEVVSEVAVESPQAGEAPPAAPEWKELARIRTLREVAERDRQRTAAEGFDD